MEEVPKEFTTPDFVRKPFAVTTVEGKGYLVLCFKHKSSLQLPFKHAIFTFNV